MQTGQHKAGDTVTAYGKVYELQHAPKPPLCCGCDFYKNSITDSTCHAPATVQCGAFILKESVTDYDNAPYNHSGCRTGIIIISSAIGTFMAALATAIYFIIQ